MRKEIGRYRQNAFLKGEEPKELIIYKDEYYNFTDENNNPLTEDQIYKWSFLASRYVRSTKLSYKIKTNPRNNFRSIYGNKEISCIESDEKRFICIKKGFQKPFFEAEFIGYGDTEEESLENCKKLDEYLYKINKTISQKRKEEIKEQEKTINIKNILKEYDYYEEEWETSRAYLTPIISFEEGCAEIMDALIVNGLKETRIEEVKELWPMVNAFRIINKKNSDIILFETGRFEYGRFEQYHDDDPRYLFSALDARRETLILKTNINNIGELEFEPISYLFTAMFTAAQKWCQDKNLESNICWYEGYIEKLKRINKWHKDFEKDPTISRIPDVSEDDMYRKLERMSSDKNIDIKIREIAKERFEILKKARERELDNLKDIIDLKIEMLEAEKRHPDENI